MTRDRLGLATHDLAAAAAAAGDGAERTAAMTRAAAGRLSYVRADALRGVLDAGAVAVARVFTALTAPLGQSISAESPPRVHALERVESPRGRESAPARCLDMSVGMH